MLYSLLELIPKDGEVYQSPFIRCYMQFCNRREVSWVVTPELLVFCHSIGIRTVEPGTPNRIIIFFTSSNSPVPTPMHSQVLFHIRYKCHHWQSGGLVADLFFQWPWLHSNQCQWCVSISYSKNCLPCELLVYGPVISYTFLFYSAFLLLFQVTGGKGSDCWTKKWSKVINS